MIVICLRVLISLVTPHPHIHTLTQAARVTHACELLKDVGPEVRARPYQYQNTPQLDLDSLVSYLYSVDLRVRVTTSLRTISELGTKEQ